MPLRGKQAQDEVEGVATPTYKDPIAGSSEALSSETLLQLSTRSLRYQRNSINQMSSESLDDTEDGEGDDEEAYYISDRWSWW